MKKEKVKGTWKVQSFEWEPGSIEIEEKEQTL